MAVLTLRPDEPRKLIHLVEQMTGADLSALDKMFAGVTLSGSMTITKQIAPNESVMLQIDAKTQ